MMTEQQQNDYNWLLENEITQALGEGWPEIECERLQILPLGGNKALVGVWCSDGKLKRFGWNGEQLKQLKNRRK